MREDRAEVYRAAADRVAVLARRLASVIDRPTGEQLGGVLIAAGWSPEATNPRRIFTAGGLTAWVNTDSATATVQVKLADFGCPRDLDPDEFDDDAAYDAARDQPYQDADAIVRIVADQLDLEQADPLAVDVRADHDSRILLRAGHWAVTVAAVQEDPDLPLIVEADLSYGADLPGRLAHLVGTAPYRGLVDWATVSARIGVDLPADYRWLMEHYGPGTFDDYLTLIPPAELPKPIPGPLVGVLRYQTPETLPVATTSDGAAVSLVLDPQWRSDRYGVRVTSPDTTPWEVSTGLLYFLVLTLSGTYRVPQFRPTFPSAEPRFMPAPAG